MRKLIVQEMLTIDGFFCGPNGEIDWHNVDAEFNEYAIGMLDRVDTLIFGRVTYDLMASYWPTSAAVTDDPHVAERMNRLHKIVFSKTQESLTWNNSEVRHEIDADEIRKLKEASGKDMIIFGSGMIVSQLAELGLIDEVRSIVAPVILGQGRTLFSTITKSRKMILLRSHAFASGNLLSVYIPS